MTILTVCQQLAPVIGIEVPSQVMASTDPDAVTLAALVSECGERILNASDWQKVKRLQTYASTDGSVSGTTQAFSLPSDYHRMPKEAKLWSTRIETPLTHIDSADRWLELDIRSYEFVIGVWTLLGDEVLIKPALTTGESVKFYYKSNLVWSNGGANIDAPTADSDTFRLGERLLRLCMVWQWKAQKNLPYGEEMANYEIALAEAVERDGGPSEIVIGRRRIRRGMEIAYPQAIDP